MAEQSEWTKPIAEPKSYPGMLRGYRNFRFDQDFLQLRAMTSEYEFKFNTEEEWWQAQCNPKGHKRPASMDYTHVSPDVNCTCGFYVNYFPNESFYTHSVSFYTDVCVRGVVETSGKLILAERGFRAQKMKLIALSVPQSTFLGELKVPRCEIFTNNQEMYEAYPQEDLTDLIGPQKVNELSSRYAGYDNVGFVDIKSALNHACTIYGGYTRAGFTMNFDTLRTT